MLEFCEMKSAFTSNTVAAERLWQTAPIDDSAPTPEDLSEWLHLTRELLPSLSRQHGWPLRNDHCFQRVCLDHAVGDVWYRHIARPAIRHIRRAQLRRAIACAHAIAVDGAALLHRRNRESLAWRGKLKRPDGAPGRLPRTAEE